MNQGATRAAFAVVASCLLAGCVEPVDAPLPATVSASGLSIPDWHYAGSFGGNASLVVNDPDPWMRRYEEGKFVSLAGLDASASEVWVCDLAVSRVQVFDLEGRFLRSIGAGVPIAGTLPTDAELYTEEQTIDPSKQEKWEETAAGQRWVQDKRNLFKAADVALTPGGYWLADQMLSSAYSEKARPANARFYSQTGRIEELPTVNTLLWPNYMAAVPLQAAVGEDWGNVLWVAGVDEHGQWQVKRPTNFTSAFRSVMHVRTVNADSSRFNFLMDVAGNAGNDLEHFNKIGGMEYFNDKLVVCDRKNRRLKVFNAHLGTDQWSQLLKIITARKRDGRLRFLSPRDIDIDVRGVMYVLDDQRKEVAVLSPAFDRIGTIPGDSLGSPRSIALSPNGTDLYISDPGHNLVHHYAAR